MIGNNHESVLIKAFYEIVESRFEWSEGWYIGCYNVASENEHVNLQSRDISHASYLNSQDKPLAKVN